MILDTLIEVYQKDGLDEEAAINLMAEDAMRGRRIRENNEEIQDGG